MTKPRQRRRLLYVGIACLFVAVAVESISFVGWWATTGAMFRWSLADQARRAAGSAETAASPAEPAAADTNRAALFGCVPHPYLGYVYDADLPAQAKLVSRYGFVDDKPPLFTRAPDRFVVGVVGGSVSLLMCDSAEPELVAALQRSPLLHDRRIEVVRLGLGGWKQPQQLFSVQLAMLLGGQFDCIVNLDGFNEVALVGENVPFGVPEWFPRSWSRLMDSTPSPEQQSRLGHIVYLREERAALATLAAHVWWSPTAQLLWLLRDRSLQRRMGEQRTAAEHAATKPSFAVTGPGPASASLDDARREAAAIWRRSSQCLQQLCASHGTLYFHFLQPNQYVPDSKPIGPAEAKVALLPGSPWEAGAVRGYPLLQEEAKALLQAGVSYEDLTGIFRDHAEPLYFDNCCHTNHEGYAILAEHIAGVIRRRLEMGDAQLVALRVQPASLHLSSPLAVAHLVVHGIEADGTEHEITASGFGTEIRATHPDRFAIGGDGGLRAMRRGSSTLTIRNGKLTAQVPVVADWPGVLEAGDGRAAADGTLPTLQLATPADAAQLQVRCGRLPLGARRLLVVSDQPIPAPVPKKFNMLGVQLLPLASDDVEPIVAVPTPPLPGVPMYLRSMVLAEDLEQVVAASNTLVLTRD